MNILFLYGSVISPTKGGVQRVTNVLADYFESNNNIVYFLGLNKSEGDNYHDDRQFLLPEPPKFYTKRNIHFFQDFIRAHNIDVVINQGGLGKDCSRLANFSNEFGAKEISVLHNSPLASIIHFSSSKADKFKKMQLGFLLPLTDIKWVKGVLLWIYKLKYKAHFKRLCRSSNRVVLLSDKFRDEFSFFVGKNSFQDKISAISNPCSFNLGDNYTIGDKEKTLLYVGRIDFMQKRVDLLIQIWNRMYRDYPEWKLVIVGDGSDLDKARKMAEKLGTERIYFEGMQKSEPYYERASIFCMTSSYEGFAMVLAEAQIYGTVPVAFNSFVSVTDIIKNGESGYLVEPFDEDAYINTLSTLMDNDEILQSSSRNCVESASQFSLEEIGNQWLELFKSLMIDHE